MNIEIIDYALYAAAAISLAAALWPRRKGIPLNTESRPQGITIEKMVDARQQKESREQQQEIEPRELIERILLSSHREVEEKAQRTCGIVLDAPVWPTKQHGYMDWDEYVRQQTTVKTQS